MECKTNFRITFKEAVDYVGAYVKRFKLDQESSPEVMNTIGGTLKVDYIKLDIERLIRSREIKLADKDGGFVADPYSFQGLMCWFCWQIKTVHLDEHFYLSFEANDDVDLENPEPLIKPDQTVLNRPFDIILYDKDLHSNIAKMLRDKRPLLHQFPDKIKRGSRMDEGARKLIRDFKTKIESFEKSNIKKPYGLFENEMCQDVVDFFKVDNLEYIRYYFGYDDNKTENRIRVILFGVDGEGKNMLPPEINMDSSVLSTKSGALLNEPIILQKSWP